MHQSSDYGTSYRADKATDGSVSGAPAMTKNNYGSPWFLVDLKKEYHIKEVIVRPSQHAGWWSLKRFRVIAGTNRIGPHLGFPDMDLAQGNVLCSADKSVQRESTSNVSFRALDFSMHCAKHWVEDTAWRN